MSKFISDNIKIDQICDWKFGDTILITSPTGSGKSHFIKNNLNNYYSSIGYKTLLISNRKLLKEQNISELSGHDQNIVAINYQELEMMDNLRAYLSKFQVLVMDECHYILSDAMFNRNTDIMLDIFLHTPKDKICLFITATPHAIYSIKKDFTYVYTLPCNYSYIKNIYFYHNASTLARILDNVGNDEKCIYFCSDALDAYENSLKYPSAEFLCSEYNSRFYKKSSCKERTNIIENEMFSCKYLFTTKVLDNGINIKDKMVKHIIIDMLDPIGFIQCLGRKRILDIDDNVTLYIKNYHGGQLSAQSRSLSNKIKFAKEFLDLGKDEFILKYKKKEVDTIIDAYSSINWAKYYSYRYFQNIYYEMVIDADKIGYKKYICDCLGKSYRDVLNAEDCFGKISLSNYLDTWIDIEMYKEEQVKFKDGFFNNIFQMRGANYRNRGLKCINAILEEDGIEYRIISKQSQKNATFGNTYWKVLRY